MAGREYASAVAWLMRAADRRDVAGGDGEGGKVEGCWRVLASGEPPTLDDVSFLKHLPGGRRLRRVGCRQADSELTVDAW
jgi:hypothetical protein